MYLLIRQSGGYGILLYPNLHSIMYLLIRFPEMGYSKIPSIFTFHNVSINSPFDCVFAVGFFDLHSIMYLLIRKGNGTAHFIVKHLHSIMYLLILDNPKTLKVGDKNLHSIMYLLIQNMIILIGLLFLIYIP